MSAATGHTAAAMAAALGAAAAFAVSNVAEMRAARRTPVRRRIDPGLLARLTQDREWVAGFGMSFVGYALQATALGLAPVVLVQPLIVTEMLFALPLAAHLAGFRLGAREWFGAALVAAGLAAFLLVARPSGQSTTASLGTWVEVIGSVAGAVVLLSALAGRRAKSSMLRASLLSVAAGTCFGLMSILTKSLLHLFATSGVLALLHPQPWLLAVTAIVGLLLAQTAFRTAPLSVCLPLIDLGEPLVASLIAVFAFGERLGRGTAILAGVVAATAVVAAGVALLDTAPAVRAAQRRIERTVQVQE
jgi:drug/metabolite transporter (DMT)-like permease